MTLTFCLTQSSSSLWNRNEISDAETSFMIAQSIERRMKEIVTRIVHSPLLHMKYQSVIPKLRPLYPLPKSNCVEFEAASEALLFIMNKNEMEIDHAKKINAALRRVSFAEAMAARKFLHLAGAYFASKQPLDETLLLLLWKNVGKPDDPAAFIEKVKNDLEENELKQSEMNLRHFDQLHGAFEHLALKLCKREEINEEKAYKFIDQAIKWNEEYISSTEKYDLAMRIVKHRSYALSSPTFILDAYSYLSLKDSSLFIKDLAIQYVKFLSSAVSQ